MNRRLMWTGRAVVGTAAVLAMTTGCVRFSGGSEEVVVPLTVVVEDEAMPVPTTFAAPDAVETTGPAPAPGPVETTTGAAVTRDSIDGAAAPDEPVLSTPCFTAFELALPADYIASDVSGGAEICHFILQRDLQADTTVIAGELFFSSSGRSFEQFVELVEANLASGQEPDLLPLQLLNSGASGRDLPILDRREIDGPNRALVITHESDRRAGFVAHSAVVEVPTPVGEPTQAIIMWALSTPENDQLLFELIDAMEVQPLPPPSG